MLDTDLSVRLYQSIAEGNTHRPMKSWQASMLCSCPKAQYLKRQGVPVLSKPSAAKLLRWSAGHHLETAIRDHINELYPDVKSNVKLRNENLDLTGEYDNLSGSTLIEVKSVHDMAFIERDGVLTLKEQTGINDRGQKTWGAKQTPHLHHLLQNYAYVLLLAEEGVKVEQITIVYLALGGRVACYTQPVETKYLDAVKRRLTELRKAWAKQEAPECICTKDGKPNTEHPLWGSVLQYCDYRDEAKGVCCEN